MAQKPWIVPIPGTTQMAHMLENTGADGVRFTPSEGKIAFPRKSSLRNKCSSPS
jgi:aryl-alcohol dehydrogenase-like predicted oxidoreductase